MTTEPAPDRRYTIISADAHAGGDIARLPALSGAPLARRVRRLGRGLRQPVRRPAGGHRLPQLGLRPTPGRERCRRHRRRGAVPQYRAAVLRGGQPGGASPDGGRLRTPLGRGPGPQPLAGRFLRLVPGPPGRRGPNLRQQHRGRPGRDAMGRRHLPPFGRDPAAHACRPAPTSPACGSPCRSRCGTCARSSACRSTSTGAEGCPTTATPRWPGPSCWSSCRGSPTGQCGT